MTILQCTDCEPGAVLVTTSESNKGGKITVGKCYHCKKQFGIKRITTMKEKSIHPELLNSFYDMLLPPRPATNEEALAELWHELIAPPRPIKPFTQLRPASNEYMYAIMNQTELKAEQARLEKQLSNLKTFIKDEKKSVR